MGKVENEDTFLDDLEKMRLEDQEPEGITLVSGADFWDWEKNKIFHGQYMGEHMDAEGEMIGYDFKDANGMDHILGANFAVKQALDGPSPKGTGEPLKNSRPWLWVKFLGKIKAKEGSFNKFKIVLTEKPEGKKKS